MISSRLRLATALAALAVIIARPAIAQVASPPRTDLDVLMEEVLANRDRIWTHLRDYVLDERERFALIGPDGGRLFGQDRTFTWYARDGVGVRSPLTANGVTVSEEERRKYEDDWLAREQRRDARERERKAVTLSLGPAGAKVEVSRGDTDRRSDDTAPDGTTEPSLGASLEPRFVSEAYFLRFKFEPGNYYFAGRETLDGREVLKIEYLPTRLYDDDRTTPEVTDPDEEEIGRKMNKVALVTLWIDSEAKQIVRYTFDNAEFGFLPGRALVRVDKVRASMTMATVLDGIWMPRSITMDGAVTLAAGSFRMDYRREFSDYRRGETSVTIRIREER